MLCACKAHAATIDLSETCEPSACEYALPLHVEHAFAFPQPFKLIGNIAGDQIQTCTLAQLYRASILEVQSSTSNSVALRNAAPAGKPHLSM